MSCLGGDYEQDTLKYLLSDTQPIHIYPVYNWNDGTPASHRKYLGKIDNIHRLL